MVNGIKDSKCPGSCPGSPKEKLLSWLPGGKTLSWLPCPGIPMLPFFKCSVLKHTLFNFD